MAIQEGMLEAFRIFGWDLLGIDLVAVINDSILGPLDPKIYEQWMVSILGVWGLELGVLSS